MRSISPKHGIVFNTHTNDFIRSYIERVMSHKQKKTASEVTVRGDSGVAGEGRVVVEPKVHSCYAINSDWMSNASSGLCTTLG